MNVLILAAGYGTRLYPLTEKIAKPLILINNKPMINFLIEKIEELKKTFLVKKIVIVSNNRFYKSFLSWKEKYLIKVEILNDHSNSEKDRLGAVMDIKFGIKNKNADWLILAGDNIFEDSLVNFLKFSKRINYPTVAIYDIKDKTKASNFGVVELDNENRIIKFIEKPKTPPSTLIATCIYYFPSNCLKFLDLFLKTDLDKDASGSYISWLVEKYRVFGYKIKGIWLDIGDFNSLKKAREIFK